MGINRKIIKEQNIAARTGKYINKAEAMMRMARREAEDAKPKVKPQKS